MSSSPAKLIHLGGDTDAPPILFIHGFGADHLSWSFIAPAFTRTHCVWAIDLPAHGGAENEVGDGSVPWLSQAVWRAIENKVGRPFTIVAHSLGGAIALLMAHAHPQDIAQLLLIAPGGLTPISDDTFISGFPQLETLEDTQIHLLKLVEAKRLISKPMAEYVLKSINQDGRRPAMARIAQNLLARTGQLEIPKGTVLIWGEDDQIVPPIQLAEGRTDIKFHLLKKTGHLPHAEAVQRVIEIISESTKMD
jgi:pimeloyl-ACP methyl ester carboxylesterase